MMRWLTGIIFKKLMGWKIEGDLPGNLKKYVIIVVPHTSWHDFYIGAMVRKLLGVSINFIAKKELFSFPFGWYFKWMGGAPIDRSANQNTVQQVARLFKERDEFRLALAPEGTRKKVAYWKSGFYYIALEANVPIVGVAFDYGSKTVKINKPFYPTGDFEKDLEQLQSFYVGVVGKVPAYT
ncbi:lysophospholipid acyltransferase family protein [Planktosalinus lacus]|uniref:Acyltransferase n=1 Tax=Planktosalinus lacus TaxID=1526573 RepID=A0A8J2VDS7_9FLAO|nr:lysophospholipid acyltransferase family protein [Planktosalinus lacus]GGE00278.1 acyltransferase [Planktosalinus lacus]